MLRGRLSALDRGVMAMAGWAGWLRAVSGRVVASSRAEIGLGVGYATGSGGEVESLESLEAAGEDVRPRPRSIQVQGLAPA